MARVVLPSSLARYTGGVTELEVEATDIRGVIRALEARYAGIGRELEEGMAVAVDAQIHQDDLFAAVRLRARSASCPGSAAETVFCKTKPISNNYLIGNKNHALTLAR